MEQLDYSMEEVAWTLGCTRLRALFKLFYPMCLQEFLQPLC